MSELPSGWISPKIVEVLELNNNGKPFQQGWSPQCENVPAGEAEWGVLKTTAIQDGEYWGHENKRLPNGLKPKPAIEVQAGDVLMTCAGPRRRCGVTCLVTKTRGKLMMSGKMYRFRPMKQVMNAQLLAYFLATKGATDAIDRMKTGISDSGLNLTHDRFSELVIVLPPINEQRRIVEKIETLFADLDAGVESLTRARARLALYRQSVLKAAFEGRLTADWRAENPDKLEDPNTLLARIEMERAARYEQALDDWQEAQAKWRADGEKGQKPAKPKRPDEVEGLSATDLEELATPPESWSWVPVGQIFQVFVGSTPSRKRSDFWDGDVAWVSSGEVQFCKIKNTAEKLTEAGFENMSGAMHPPGTVMLGMIGEGKTRGQAAILEIEATHNQNCAAIRVDGTPVPTLIAYYFFLYRYEITRSIGSGNNQKALNKTRIRNMPFPLCSPEEYREILQRLEAKLTNIEALQAQIDDGLARSKALRQSILKRAFSGKLVSQDPSDEPACALLGRIKAEKVDAPKMRKRQA
jgi:type I restriction enzyme, S subunit